MSQRLNKLKTDLGVSAPTRIQQYRQKYPIDRNQLRDHIYGKKYRQIVDQCYALMLNNPQIYKQGDIEDMDRAQQRIASAKMLIHYHKNRPVHASQIQQDPHAVNIAGHASYGLNAGFSVRGDITLHLYTKSIILFHNPNNPVHKEWIRKGLNLQDIGCFGLTQIGHGSNTKALETQARYDHARKGFILNTPKQTGYKFWIGGAAQMANMGLIWAQLIIGQKRYGVHPFVVPLRDPKTLKTFNGVIIGQCGSKIGLHQIDNGYIGFSNYSVSIDSLLDRISGVDSNGNFRTIQQSLQRRHGHYMGGVSLGRAFITINAPTAAANALLIAIKYSCIRRQFQAPNQPLQTLLIDYPLTRFRLMPYLATTYVYFNIGADILKQYGDKAKMIADPTNKISGYMHAISAVGKATASWFATQVIGSCRHFLGGHGYSSYSRLGRIYFDQEINTTWQGDNHMLLQQVTKYALKTVQKLRNKSDQTNYLNFVTQDIVLPQAWTKQNLSCLKTLTSIMRRRFLQAHDETVNAMIQLKSKGFSDEDIWNKAQPYHGKKLALLLGHVYYLTTFQNKISNLSTNLKQLSQNCLRLFTLTILQKQRWSSPQTRSLIQSVIKDLCDWLAPRSISLVQTIATPAQIIGSPFADWNGDKMWDKYLGMIYSGKDVFARASYYEDIIQSRNQA